jgi:6-pyruvoyltetrahydropterin/6-carboxytetrahydropterin synthase
LAGEIIAEEGSSAEGMVMDFPTAENLARTAFDILRDAFNDRYANHLRLQRACLYETPNCWADATGGE